MTFLTIALALGLGVVAFRRPKLLLGLLFIAGVLFTLSLVGPMIDRSGYRVAVMLMMDAGIVMVAAVLMARAGRHLGDDWPGRSSSAKRSEGLEDELWEHRHLHTLSGHGPLLCEFDPHDSFGRPAD